MKRFITALLLICSTLGHAADRPPSVGIIFDTDMGGDCDDVGALFVLHGAVERGEAKLLATMGCISSEAIAPCLDAINTWFGRPEIPVGTLKDAGFLAGRDYPAELVKHFPFVLADEDSTRLILHDEVGDAFGLEVSHHAAQMDGGLLHENV